MEVILKGIAFGGVLALAIGPVFFSLVQTSIERGFAAGIFMALGISFSDIVYVVMSYLGVSKLSQDLYFKFYVGLVGGIIMIVFGVFSFIKSNVGKNIQNKNYRGKNIWRQVLKGILINGINPFVFIFWVGVTSLVTIEYGYDGGQLKVFFVTVLSIVFLTDVIKSYLSNKLRKLITLKSMKIVNGFVGSLLIFFGIRLIYLAITHHQGLLGI